MGIQSRTVVHLDAPESGDPEITPFELAIRNGIDRFSIAIEAIDRVSRLKVAGAHAKHKFRNERIACRSYAYECGIDKPEIVSWKWPY